MAQGGAGHVCNIYERKHDIKLVPNIECTFIRDRNKFACEHSGVAPGQSIAALWSCLGLKAAREALSAALAHAGNPSSAFILSPLRELMGLKTVFVF